MITTNIENTPTSALSETIKPNTIAKQYCMQKSTSPVIFSNLTDFETNNITDYKIYIPKETEQQIFSKIKNSLPSVKDFLILCIAKNQKLAADKLDMMLTNTSSAKVVNWQLNHVNKYDFSFSRKYKFDNLGRPLVIAAKYGNTPVCKILIKHIEKETASISSYIRSIFTLSNVVKNYNLTLKRNESEICNEALIKALEYNNIETAEYIYDIFFECIKVVYSQNTLKSRLFHMMEQVNTVPELQFLLQKIFYLSSIEDKSVHGSITETICRRIAKLSRLWAEKKNWELVKYVVEKYVYLITISSEVSQRRLLYEILQNKQFDIAKELIKNIQVESIFNKDAGFKGSSYCGYFTFLDILKRDLDPETIDWLLANIKSNCIKLII